jgi:uncharacterized protein (TIGR02231 family)
MMPRAALVFAWVLLPAIASAGEIATTSRVDKVTVFSRGAEITRIADVTLPAGTHAIVVQDLPANAVEGSIRVEGQASGGLDVGSVDTRTVSSAAPDADAPLEDSERARIEAEIFRLRDERASLDGEIEAATVQKTLAQNLAQLPASWLRSAAAVSAGTTAPPAPDWPQLFDLVGGKVGEMNAAILRARTKQRELDRRLQELEAQLNRQPPDETERTEAVIMVEARTPLTAQLNIRYQIRDARWTPIYDARLSTGAAGSQPALVIARRAEVTQDTGEDWENVELTLSTTRPEGDTRAPNLAPLRVGFRPEIKPAPLPRSEPYALRSMEPPLMAAPPGMAPEAAGAMMKQDVAVGESGAAIEASAFQAVFRVPGRSSVKSGIGARRLLIATDTLEPNLRAVTTPKESATAFLHASFTHDSDAPFLPGRVSLYRDGVFTGTGDFPLLPSGQEYDLGFGSDDLVKVARVNLKRARGETGIISSSSVDEQHFKITVNNLHSQPMKVIVLDQMPYSEDEKITVEMLPITTQPLDLNYEDKRGVIAWTLDMKPKEERELAFSYQVTWPAKRDVIFTSSR